MTIPLRSIALPRFALAVVLGTPEVAATIARHLGAT